MGLKRNKFLQRVKKYRVHPDGFGDERDICREKEEKDGSDKKLYPNCDTTIWLRSCEKEIIEPIEGVITGNIPKWIDGCLLRNGPGSLKVGNMEFEHLFDSSSLLHRYNVTNGKVTYQNRFLQTDTFKKNLAAQRIVVTEFGTKSVPDPCQSIFQRISAVFAKSDHQSDNAMISIYPFGDEYFAMTETPIIHRIDPKDLATKERINLGHQLGIVNHTSHPHVLKNGTVYNLGMAIYKSGPKYCILEFPPKKEENRTILNGRIVATVPARWKFHPSYMHTFGITRNYFIIVEQPLSVSVPGVVKNRLFNRPLAEALKWYQQAETIIYLVSRTTGEISHTFITDSFFYLHIINQYEEDDHVVLDICCYKDPAMLNCMYIDSLKMAQTNPDYANMFRGRPLRFVMPLRPNNESKDKTRNLNQLPDIKSEAYLLDDGRIHIKPELLCNIGCETPRINYDENLGKKYKYFYAISSDVDLENPGTLIKVDVEKKTKKTWCEDNIYPSEPIFVPSLDAKDEDDGVILSALIWGQGKTNQTGVIILDAKTWTEVGRATFSTDGPVPKCLHGWFVPQNVKE